MGFYANRILPTLIDRGMQNKALRKHRPRIPSLATGRVLEVGFGSGLNLPYYRSTVTHLFALEPSQALLDKSAERTAAAAFPVEPIAASAADIPLAKNSIDTIVSTWTLCSIPGIEDALRDMRRVLKSDGRLLFIEHGHAPDPEVARWQDRLAPVFRCIAGCNPNRPIDTLIGTAGFRITEIEKGYFDGPRFISYHFVGQAKPG